MKYTRNITEVVFILDQSGSMYGLTNDTIGGFNSMLKQQKKESGECIVSTVLFDSANNEKTIHDRVPIQNVAELTEKDYQPCGTTALLDAIGKTITHIKAVQAALPDVEKPARTLFIITTDGQENDSIEYNQYAVKKMIEDQKKENWEFIFMGANIDAVQTASTFGISESMSINYHADSCGTQEVFQTASNAMSVSRNMSTSMSMGQSFGTITSWREGIDNDFQNRNQWTSIGTNGVSTGQSNS